LWVKLPVAKSEKAAGCSVLNSASAAAIFIGCSRISVRPSSSPTYSDPSAPTTARQSAILTALVNSATSCPRRRCQADTASATSATVSTAARITCRNAHTVRSLNSTFQMSTSLALPFTTR
jgi:hypothetical protein